MKRYSIILLISLFTALQAAAQLYPVRTITNVGAPYPLSLEQYGSFDNNRLQLTIIPNDIALQNYPVKLRLVISGGWFKIYTNPSFIHKNILLNNGETMTFTGADLAEWFNPDNLIFEGYSKAQYMKTGRLPEGVYQIWFEAWDLYRDFNISGTTKAMVFTLENEPPILNFPENKKELEPYDPQNIVFNWSFRQSPFSAGGSSHQYRFELWEIDPDDMNAEEAVRVMRPIYTTEVNATTLNYTAAEPLLFKGKRYAWRIQVFDPMSAMRYKNDGYSQVFWFRFGKDIPVPVLSLDKTTTSSITVKWENDYRITKYELRYRNKAKEGANWYTKDASGQSATIDNLEQNTPYEIQLHGYNGSQEGDYSESVTAKTNQDKAFACGTAPGETNTENTDPLSMLKSGDIFRASDFDIEVYRTSGANGTFTGRGFAMIPYLKFVKFEVEFNGIQINKDYRMTSGQVRFIYNANNGMVANLTKIFEDLKSQEPRVVEENPYTKTADKKITSNADITEVTVDANGVVTAKTSDGRTTQVRGSTNGDMVAVSGGSDDSEQYVADTKSGTVYKGSPEKATSGKKPEQPASKTSGPAQYEVTFLPHILQQGGMDIPTNNSPAANYHQIQIGSKTIQVPWKSVESNKIDRIVAHIAGDPADTVRFLTKEGNLVMTAPGDKAFVSKSVQNTPSSGTFKQLLVTGREDEDELKAWYPEYEQVNDSTKKQNRILAGQVNIAAYDKITLDVCIVEVNGATVPETLPIEKELNEIYASSVVQWKVSRIKDFKVNIEGMQNGIFDNTDPNNDMDYTDHEKQVKEALKDHKDYHRKTLYLFFIGGKTKDNMLKGYMPFNKQFGFIFRENQAIQELIRTMAHELGHGAFRLRHPFSNKCPYPQTKGQTNNLMDYVDAGKALQALALHKYQWDEVHDFDLGLNWFEDEGEGEIFELQKIPAKYCNSDGTATFLSPSGNPIVIPTNAKNIQIFHGHDLANNVDIVTGILYHFEIGSNKYNLVKEGVNYKYLSNSKGEYKYTLTSANSNKAIWILPVSMSELMFFQVKPVLDNSNAYKNELTYPIDYPKGIIEGSIEKFSYKKDGIDFFLGQEGYYSEEEDYFVKGNTTKDYFLMLLKIGQLRNNYPELFTKFCDFGYFEKYETLEASTYEPKIYGSNSGAIITSRPITIRPWEGIVFKENLKELYAKNRKAFYNRFISEFFNYITEFKSKNVNFWANLNPNNTEQEVIQNTINLSDLDISKIQTDKIVLAINIILRDCGKKDEQDKSIDDYEETAIVKLIKASGNSQEILAELIKNSSLEEKVNILKAIFDGTGDSFMLWGKDNLTILTKAILWKWLNSTYSLEIGKTAESVNFYDVSFYRSFFDMLVNMATNGVMSCGNSYSPPRCESRVSLQIDEKTKALKVRIDQDLVRSFVTYGTISSTDYEPYEPIIFINKSNLSALDDFSSLQLGTFPALFLAYADKKGNEQFRDDLIQCTMDVISMATAGGTLIRGGTILAKILAVSNFTSSAVNFTVSVSGTKLPPDLRQFLTFLDIATSAIDISVNLAKGIKNFSAVEKLRMPKTSEVKGFFDKFNQLDNAKISEYLLHNDGRKIVLYLGILKKEAQARQLTEIVSRIETFEKKIGQSVESLNDALKSGGNYDKLINGITKGDNLAHGANNLLDDVFNAQKAVVNQNKNIISTASNNAKGAFGEITSDVYLTEKGFQPLHPRKSALTDGWGETGIDGVFKKDGQYYIVEAKYTGFANLKTTDDGLQMSDTWIRGSERLVKSVGKDIADDIIDVGYKRILAKVSPDGNIVYKELNYLGKEIGDFVP